MENRHQEQIDPADAVIAPIRATFRKHHGPPRPVNIMGLWVSMYHGKVLKVLLATSVNVALFTITFYQQGGEIGRWLLRLLWGLGILLFALGPGRNAPRVARYVREGLLTQADVTEAHHGVDKLSRKQVRGHRVVHHPALGDFHDEFTIVAPWADSVTQLARLNVVVLPNEPKTVLTLGPSTGETFLL